MKVLFVCMGNICRSPSAQGVFEKLLIDKNINDEITVDSAGTHSYHVGGKADSRSMKAALNRNIDISQQRARKVTNKDFELFDYIIAMDNDNHQNLLKICPPQHENKIHKMMEFSPHSKYTEIPDPYYSDEQGFKLVLDLLESASIGLLDFIESKRH